MVANGTAHSIPPPDPPKKRREKPGHEKEAKTPSLESYNLSRTEWEHLIDEWIIGLYAERDRAILKRRLLDGICFEPLAEEFELSVRHTKDIVYKRKAELFRHI